MVVVPYDYWSLREQFGQEAQKNIEILKKGILKWEGLYKSITAGTVPSIAGIMKAILLYANDADIAWNYHDIAELARSYFLEILKIKFDQRLEYIFDEVTEGAFRGAMVIDDYLSVLTYTYCTPSNPEFAKELKTSKGFGLGTL